MFRFETGHGRGNGVVRLMAEGSTEGSVEPKAWTLLTALDELKGHEEHVGRLGRRARRTRATSPGRTGSTGAEPAAIYRIAIRRC